MKSQRLAVPLMAMSVMPITAAAVSNPDIVWLLDCLLGRLDTLIVRSDCCFGGVVRHGLDCTCKWS